MKRAPVLVLLGAVVVMAAGCAGSSHQRDARRPAARPAKDDAIRAAIRYRSEGVTLSAVPAGYRPAVSRAQVLGLYRRWHAALKLNGTPSVRLWMVHDRSTKPGNRDYQGWVLTFRHTKPISYGPASTPEKSVCALVAIYDIRTRAWTESFQDCSGRPSSSCDLGCTPANQPIAAAVGGLATSPGTHPSLRTDLRLTRTFACLDANRHRVNRRTLKHFHAVTAVECIGGQRVYPGRGQWEVLVRKVAVSSVAGLQRYYERPDELNLPKKGVMCSLVLTGFPIPAFADAQGRWVTPARWPRDRCGDPAGFPPTVRWHVVRVRRIRQLISAAALAANCPMRAGNTVAWAGPPRNAPAGAPLFDRTPTRFHVCIYRTRPTNFATGYFVRGFRLGAARTRQLLRALTRAGPKRGCPKQRAFAAINANRTVGATIELGGCYRVATAEGARTANPAVVRAILDVR